MMRRLGKGLVYMILVPAAAGLGLIFLLPTFLGFNLAVVYSGSMEPAMPVGAMALMEPVDPSEIEVGDIIAFNPVRDPDTIVSHRVVEILGDSASIEFRTKGDANEDPDVLSVPAANVLAKVSFNIPYMGHILARTGDHTRSRLGFALLVCLPTLSLIGIALRDVSVMLNPRKKRLAKLKERNKRRNKRRSRHGELTRVLNFT